MVVRSYTGIMYGMQHAGWDPLMLLTSEVRAGSPFRTSLHRLRMAMEPHILELLAACTAPEKAGDIHSVDVFEEADHLLL